MELQIATVRPNGITENIFELVLHFVADTYTDKFIFWNLFVVADADTAVLCSLEGGSIADQNDF